MKDVSGKAVLLTGASTGIGPVIAGRLRLDGARFVLSARNQAALTKLADELGDSRIVVADLSRAGEPERLAGEAGPVDVLVAHAGVPASVRLASFALEEIDRALAVNLRAGIVLAHQLPPPVIERKPQKIGVHAPVAGQGAP